jgi:hypothetical protein
MLSASFLILLSASCVQVDVVERDDTALQNLTPELSTSHNLTASGIIFEPPLDEIGRSVLRNGVDLFVIVENRGLYEENDVSVQLTLKTDDQTAPLFQTETILSTIPANQVRQAHFRLTGLVDLHPHYTLHVDVAPCANETFIVDNHRVFDLYVTPVR